MTYRSSGRSGPPVWLLVLTAAALVFGGYLIWTGVRNYMAAELQGIAGATEVAFATATANVPPTANLRFTPAPTRTPIPACQDFVVIVREAIIRECPNTACAIREVRHEGDVVCVLQRDYENDEWYIVDLDQSTFFTDLAYMHESIIRALNPTPTPTITPTPTLTETPIPSDTPLPTPPPTDTPNTATPPTRTPTFTPSPTPPLIIG